jgi:hypothetical protein
VPPAIEASGNTTSAVRTTATRAIARMLRFT